MHLRYIAFRKYLLSFIELAFVLNLLILDTVILARVPQPPLAATTQQPTLTSPLPQTSTTPTVTVSSVSQEVTPTPLTSFFHESNPTVKEYYIPFGTGQSSASDWEDVSGLQTYIDSTNYPSVKQIVFEASVNIPTGNEWASVRLFNATDQHPVWFSEVTLSGGTPQLLISSPINLDQGKKLYKIQMKTQLQYTAILNQARVHILIP